MWSMVSNCILYSLSCLPLCYPMECSPPSSSIHVIYQVRITEWVAISFSRGSSWPRHWTCVSCIQAGSLPLNHQERVSNHYNGFLYSVFCDREQFKVSWYIYVSVCVCFWLFKSYHQKNEVNISCQFYIRKIETIKW